MKLDDLYRGQPDLPIWTLVSSLRESLRGGSRAVLVAPPGAGKSSLVPLLLLAEDWLQGRRILMLEPRRLAARSLAWRMAELLGEPLGQTVGLRTRDENHGSARTRIEVLTEALLSRRLQSEPELAEVGLIIFDEFHERSLHADLGLALARDVQQGLRDDLRLLLMSATLDEQALAARFDAPVLRCEGRSHPVAVRYEGAGGVRQPLEQMVATVIRRCIAQESGSLLVFLPGEGEIRRLQRELRELPDDCSVHPLYGRMPREDQAAALRPARAGQRKIVLATAVAETSLTIDGVRVVIDAGLARGAVYDPSAGFAHLRTRRVTRDAADQRAGRAGRTAPGVCIRLWSAEEVLEPIRAPEMRSADLAEVALNVAAWGGQPDWLEAPPAGPWAQACDVLQALGLSDAQGRITPDGRQVVEWGAHPRVGRLLLDARAGGQLAMACDLAALLQSEGRPRIDVDVHQLWLAWRRGGASPDWCARMQRESLRWRRRLGVGKQVEEADPGPLLAAAFPERIAQRRSATGAYLLANGRGARMAPEQALAGSPYLVVLDLDGRGEGQIRLAAEYSEARLRQQFAEDLVREEQIRFDARKAEVRARLQCRFHALVLEQQPCPTPDAEAVRQALLAGIRGLGLACLPWTTEAQNLRQRLHTMARSKAQWPEVSDDRLLAELDEWLGPYLYGLRRLDDLPASRLIEALTARLEPAQAAKLEQHVPRQLSLPSGRRCRLDYAGEDGPVLAVRIQDLFGQDATPTVAGEPVLLHLLSPARRPLAVTRDLPSFWRNAYPEVRKQMRGRYPKHDWPEQPWLATPPQRKA